MYKVRVHLLPVNISRYVHCTMYMYNLLRGIKTERLTAFVLMTTAGIWCCEHEFRQIIQIILISIIIGKHMKMLRFKLQQNRTINEEFDFLRGERRKGSSFGWFRKFLHLLWCQQQNAPFLASRVRVDAPLVMMLCYYFCLYQLFNSYTFINCVQDVYYSLLKMN